jgi:hypothetical protein
LHVTAPQDDPTTPGETEEIKPLNVDGVRVIALGTLAWAVALIVMLIVNRHSWWVWVCVAGFGLGLVGIPNQARYQRRLG